jgi:hypothetical protein
MKRYAVVFEESAQTDVRSSYDWGCRVWGKKKRNSGSDNCGQQSQDNSALYLEVFRSRRKTMSSLRKFGR